MNDARISVVIPLFNAERYVAETLESVLGQSLAPFEVIVIDDGSSDDGREVVRRFETVQLVEHEHGGIGATRNAGIALARGELVALLDADDLWMPGKLAAQVELIGTSGADGAFSHITQFVSPDAVSERRPAFESEPMEGIAPSTFIARRKVFERVGPMTTAVRVGEFIDWHARALDAGFHFAMHPDVLVRRRLHDNNTGIRERGARSDYLRVLKDSLDRRRGREHGG